MSVEMPKIPKLSETCLICNNELRFAIQKSIDDGMKKSTIATTYNLSAATIITHIDDNHREALITLGTIDYVLKKKAIDIGLKLSDLIEKWSEGLDNRNWETIKDSDAIKAMELYLKAKGSLVNKTEVTVKRSVKDIFNDILNTGEDNEVEEEKGKDVAITESEATKL